MEEAEYKNFEAEMYFLWQTGKKVKKKRKKRKNRSVRLVHTQCLHLTLSMIKELLTEGSLFEGLLRMFNL